MKLGDKSILCPLWAPLLSPVAWVTGAQVSPPPHGQPIIRCQQPQVTGSLHPCWDLVCQFWQVCPVTGPSGLWEVDCVSVCKPISLCPADSGQIIPAVTFLLRTRSSKHLTSKFSWTLRSYLLMLQRGKIRFISSFLSQSTTRSLTCIWRVKVQACIAHFSQRIYLLNATLRIFHVKSHESDQPQ